MLCITSSGLQVAGYVVNRAIIPPIIGSPSISFAALIALAFATN